MGDPSGWPKRFAFCRNQPVVSGKLYILVHPIFMPTTATGTGTIGTRARLWISGGNPAIP